MRQLTNSETAAFCEQLAWLVHSGIGLGEGLRLMAEDEADEKRKKVYLQAADAVDEGNSLSEVLREAGCFPVYACGSVGTGEETGRLEEALRALKLYYEDKERMNRRLRSALLQPSLLVLLMMIVLGVLLTQVLPVFQSVYASLGGTMTGAAGLLLKTGLWLKDAIWLVYGVLGAVVAVVLLFAVWTPFREKVTGLWKRYAGDRGVMRKLNDAAIAQVMAMGLGSGMVLEDTMDLAADVTADVPKARERCLRCKEALLSGEPLVDSLKKSEVLPVFACRLLSAGMQYGNGDTVMAEIAEKLTEEADIAVTSRIEKAEPALVLTVSVLVGVILLVVMLPLINIMEAIG